MAAPGAPPFLIRHLTDRNWANVSARAPYIERARDSAPFPAALLRYFPPRAEMDPMPATLEVENPRDASQSVERRSGRGQVLGRRRLRRFLNDQALIRRATPQEAAAAVTKAPNHGSFFGSRALGGAEMAAFREGTIPHANSRPRPCRAEKPSNRASATLWGPSGFLVSPLSRPGSAAGERQHVPPPRQGPSPRPAALGGRAAPARPRPPRGRLPGRPARGARPHPRRLPRHLPGRAPLPMRQVRGGHRSH